MTDIKPRYDEHGEPICNEYACPRYDVTCDAPDLLDVPCIPALRQQRDSARMGWVKAVTGGYLSGTEQENNVEFATSLYGPAAAARLFPEVKP